MAKLGSSKRHLAQEEKANNEKSVEEVKKTKSYASLMNWGHDVLKKRGDVDGNERQVGYKRKKLPGAQSGANKKRETRKGQASKDKQGEEEESGANKKRETRQGKASKDEKEEEDDGEEDIPSTASDYDPDEKYQDAVEAEDEEAEGEEAEDDDVSDQKAKKGPEPGDTVSWKWGGGNPEGKVLDVKEEK